LDGTVGGGLHFGHIEIGNGITPDLRIYNRGTDPLTVTGIRMPEGPFVLSWSAGTIEPGGMQKVAIQFRPTAVGDFSGPVVVEANHTAGSNTIAAVAFGDAKPVPLPRWSKTGTGNAAFDMPYLRRVRIIGIYNGHAQNFVVWVNGRLVVNEIIGTDDDFTDGVRYQGDHQVTAPGPVRIESSNGVDWSFEEIG
jgi:hypothetical protein